MTTAEINFRSNVWRIVHSEPLKHPIANLHKDYSKQGSLILVTKIKPQKNV